MATRTRPQTKSFSKQVAVQPNQQQQGQKKNIKTHVVESLNPFNVGVFCACSTLVGGALSIYMTNYWFGKKAAEKANQDKKDLADHRNGCLSDSQDSHSNDSREKSSSSRSHSSRSSSSGSYDRDYRDYYDDRRRRDYDRRRDRDYDYEERESYSRRR
ncbi:hypothetical protein HII31_01900 [Pseudocercospora fuligena]|uniref:Uncharacterized protein n=1 Tax=Pseudocercospora fuligena TaxID=685502 RepID=A0A8H6RV37_9PEZI|nr:hypothetical protein HII31_01900 [Pseudocercospora fuligena]